MYNAITNVEAFNEGQLLVRTTEPQPVSKIPSIASKQNEFYVVREVNAEKLVLQKAIILGKAKPIQYTVEEIPITDVLQCYWYAMN
ncbi:MAG: hypothetical protein JWN76_37 [Chitinophagaceae bacterium]|nr:hypothetical protein [Chitinophagaceae bacterium]